MRRSIITEKRGFARQSSRWRCLKRPRRASAGSHGKRRRRLLWAAWRYREVQKGKPTGRRSRQHIAQFILLALYTGTRAGAVCGAALQPTIGRGWIDLDRGVFYRRARRGEGDKEAKPPVPLPPELLAPSAALETAGAALRRRMERRADQVDLDKAFRAVVKDGGSRP